MQFSERLNKYVARMCNTLFSLDTLQLNYSIRIELFEKIL